MGPLICLDYSVEHCPRIQFAAGLVMTQGELLVSFGENDCETRIMRYNLAEVEKSLMSVGAAP